jgi:hypothetical protein
MGEKNDDDAASTDGSMNDDDQKASGGCKGMRRLKRHAAVEKACGG